MDLSGLGRQAALLRAVTAGAEPRRIADLAETLWVDVDGVLTPIIGSRGVGALYTRSVNLLRAEYPWLEAAYGHAADRGAFAVLGSALAQQSAATAARANGALLQTFYGLLANLIGEALTARLLCPALDDLSLSAAEVTR